MSFKKILFLSVLIFCLLALAAHNRAYCLEKPEDFAVIVNGETIPFPRFTRAIEATKTDLIGQREEITTLETGASVEAEEENLIEAAVLNQLIDSVLVEQGLKKEGLTVSEEDIRSKIEELKKGFPSSKEFHRSIAEQNMTIDDLKVNIKRQLSVDKIKKKLRKNLIVLDEEIEEFYNRNIDIFVQEEKVWARKILVKSTEEVVEVIKKLGEGEDFGEVAKELSKDLDTKDIGGDMGFVSKNEMNGALAEMAFILKPGHVSPVIETEDGYYFIKVEDRMPAKRTSISAARKSIERFLLDEKSATAFQKWLDNQRFEANIEISEKLKHLLK